MRLLIASRKSDLARLQSYTVAEEILKKFPEIEIDFEFSSSFGDQNPDAPLWKMPEKGVFTEDFREGLANGTYDMVVHSWKDLPSDITSTSKIHTLKRADARDLLLIKKSSFNRIQESKKINIFTSSPRRSYHLKQSLLDLLPYQISDLEFHVIRGNINTRVRKLFEGEVDGLVVAKAAIDRLLSAHQIEFKESKSELRELIDLCHWMVLPLSLFPTAAAQGALAIESRADNVKVHQILDVICDQDSFDNASAEREVLKQHGGGCHQKIGINFTTYPFGRVKSLSGETENGNVIFEYKLDRNVEQNNDAYWPQNKEHQLFSKEYLKTPIPIRELFVSHQYALPENYSQNGSEIWCSGTKTWKQLAQRGVWVNGCNDSLGEKIEQNLEIIAGRTLNWLKLTHANSPYNQYFETLITYKLTPKENSENVPLNNFESFFWMSGSQFLYAIEKYPEIKNRKHACGPGNTFETLIKYVSHDNLNIYLSYDHWLSERKS